ncbi:MAG: hypothetical protein ACHQ1H_13170 [Nitrososphaerales archaeon]
MLASPIRVSASSINATVSFAGQFQVQLVPGAQPTTYYVAAFVHGSSLASLTGQAVVVGPAGERIYDPKFGRVGVEVIVTFLDGNPDQPIIVGAVFNLGQFLPFGITAITINGFASPGQINFQGTVSLGSSPPLPIIAGFGYLQIYPWPPPTQ